MAVLEEEFLASRSLKPLCYKRFIDDIFMIWPHGETDLLKFIGDFNRAHPTISFSHHYSQDSVNFLDVSVSLSGGRLTTKLYRKPTDTHQYLHFYSSHVRHCKTGIPYSQAHRFKRICSNKEDFSANCALMKDALLKQKYPAKIIDDAVNRAGELNRADILKAKLPDSEQCTNLILTHSASVPQVSAILRKHHNILAQSDRLKRIFVEPPRVVYRRNKNLRDSLTKSTLNPSRGTGCMPCNKSRCQVCPHMRTTQKATSTASNFSVQIKGNFTCDTANVIYLLECTICSQQYIGQTETPFRIRFNNHRSHTKSLLNLPVSKHVNLPGHSFNDLKATILESGFRSHHDREIRESYLIYKFNTTASGINESKGKLTSLPSD